MWINFIANLQHLDWNRKKLASFLQPYNFYRELLRTFYSLKKLFQSMNFNTTSIEDFVPWASFGYFLGRNARSLGRNTRSFPRNNIYHWEEFIYIYIGLG